MRAQLRAHTRHRPRCLVQLHGAWYSFMVHGTWCMVWLCLTTCLLQVGTSAIQIAGELVVKLGHGIGSQTGWVAGRVGVYA